MKKRLFLLCLSFSLLSACKMAEEAQEAVVNLSNEAIEIQNDVKTTVDQFNKTVNSVNQATQDIKELTQPKE